MSLPTEVQTSVEDSGHLRGHQEVWPTTAEPTSPLWRYAFHRAAKDRFGAAWMAAGYVSCGAGERTDIAFAFPGVVVAAGQIYAEAVTDPSLVALLSDEPDHRFPTMGGRYTVPA